MLGFPQVQEHPGGAGFGGKVVQIPEREKQKRAGLLWCPLEMAGGRMLEQQTSLEHELPWGCCNVKALERLSATFRQSWYSCKSNVSFALPEITLSPFGTGVKPGGNGTVIVPDK